MPSYYVDTGRGDQVRIDNCDRPENAIEEFCGQYYHGHLEKCSGNSSYKGWSKVTFYVSPPHWDCANFPNCDELVEKEGEFCGGDDCTFLCEECDRELDFANLADGSDDDICKTCYTPLYQLARAGEDD